ncbi:BLUF domain-containing protein [Neptuniibacter sp. PT8_73]|uniref:BLUF domain-containing protein n=1 Tax=Neptuniibacter sp. PT8_73 TaxID=3398206 RepID=UPI0039F55CD6
MLHQFVYISHQANEFSLEGLRELMNQARTKNKRLELTGLLLFDPPLFFQVLEGPEASIKQIAADIRADTRHRDMDIIYTNDNLAEREFSRWQMGFRFLGTGDKSSYQHLDERVKRLLRMSHSNGQLAHDALVEFCEMDAKYFDLP